MTFLIDSFTSSHPSKLKLSRQSPARRRRSIIINEICDEQNDQHVLSNVDCSRTSKSSCHCHSYSYSYSYSHSHSDSSDSDPKLPCGRSASKAQQQQQQLPPTGIGSRVHHQQLFQSQYRLRRSRGAVMVLVLVGIIIAYSSSLFLFVLGLRMLRYNNWLESFSIYHQPRSLTAVATATATATTAATTAAPVSTANMADTGTDSKWYPLGSTTGSTNAPYSVMTPHMNVLWARGWYNVLHPLPSTVPMDYYNRAGLGGGSKLYPQSLLKTYFPPTLCGPRWMRIDDVEYWIKTVFPNVTCPITLLTGDGILDVPFHVTQKLLTPAQLLAFLESPYLTAWYAQNLVVYHPKFHPIPVGLPIHYGFDGSPNSAHTLSKMLQIRTFMPSWKERSRKIFFDPGTIMGGGPRQQARMEAFQELQQCSTDRIEIMTSPQDPVTTWQQHYSTHQFAVVVRGTGWDTYRTYEYLFYGTVPILLADTPVVDLLLIPAHVPIVRIQQWSDLCHWTDQEYDWFASRYEHWIANAHHWLQPSLWVPRNQTEMDRLCNISPGCRQTTTGTSTTTGASTTNADQAPQPQPIQHQHQPIQQQQAAAAAKSSLPRIDFESSKSHLIIRPVNDFSTKE